MNFESIIDEGINNNKAMQGSFSGSLNKDGSKIKFKTIIMKGEEHLQIEKFIDKKAFHDNIAMNKAKEKIIALMNDYKQLFITVVLSLIKFLITKGK